MTRAFAAAIGALFLLPSCVSARAAEPSTVRAPLSQALPAPTVLLPPQSWAISGTPEQGGVIRGEISPMAVGLELDGRSVAVAPDGTFLIGFDRDAPPTAMLVEIFRDGSRMQHPLAVRPRAWRIERVDAPYRAGKSDAEFDALRPAELAAIAAARAVRTDATGWRGPFRWPATGRQSGWFGSQRVYQGKPGSYHGGADVAVPTGTPVIAPADGVVILVSDRPYTLEGNLLMLDHGASLSSAFLHLSRIDVRVGDRVRAGQPIALSGATGRATGPHLHWGLQWQGAKLDPLLVAGPVPAG